jgi:DNA-binding transcriptional regulator YdaS (Cro superfamily)
MHTTVKQAAKRVGGVAKLARELGITQSAVYQWEEVPAERVADLERITGLPRSHFRPDLFSNVDASRIDRHASYEHDYYSWLSEQATCLRQRNFSALDLAHLIDEIEDLARAEKREIENRLGVLLIHLLKWSFQPETRSGGWSSTIVEQRARILKRLQESPSLRGYPAEILGDEYGLAVTRAAAETGLPVRTFPERCPYSIDQVLDPDFLP